MTKIVPVVDANMTVRPDVSRMERNQRRRSLIDTFSAISQDLDDELSAGETGHDFHANKNKESRVLSTLQKELIAASLLLMLYFLIGYSFYSRLEGWDFLDSVYFAICTITTVGYGDLHAKGTDSKLFTIFYQFVGFALAGAALGTLANAVLLWQRRYTKAFGVMLMKESMTAAVKVKEASLNFSRQQSLVFSKSTKMISRSDPEPKNNAGPPKKYTAKKASKVLIAVGNSLSFTVLKVFMPVIIFLLLGLVLGHIEGLSPIDSFYLSSITITGAIVALVHRNCKRTISAKTWLSMDKDKSGDITELEFVSHMLVAMKQVDKSTVDILVHHFKALSGGENTIHMRDIEELKVLMTSV